MDHRCPDADARSKLFVPASRPELFAKALASAADAISFDLEDAVAESRKDEARATLAAFLATEAGPTHGKTILVRVNAPGTAHFEADMRAMAATGVQMINLPMVENPDQVQIAAQMLADFEAKAEASRPISLLLNIETPRGLRLAALLAGAHPRVAGLQIGYADLMEPLGIDRHDEAALSFIRLSVRLAAAEAGVPAFDAAYGRIGDDAGYRAECIAARRQGYAGKSCIHPSQIAIANEIFSPGPQEIAAARKILAAAAEAEANGIGAFTVDGQMIDAPFLSRARAIVALARQTDPTPTGKT